MDAITVTGPTTEWLVSTFFFLRVMDRLGWDAPVAKVVQLTLDEERRFRSAAREVARRRIL